MTTRRRKQLEEWQKADAARLDQLWMNRQPKISEAEAADKWLGGKSQGALWQYRRGVVPLNLRAALKFAAGLKCNISDISPTLAKELPSGVTSPLGSLGADKNLLQLVSLYLAVDDVGQAEILVEANKIHNKQFQTKSASNPYNNLPIPASDHMHENRKAYPLPTRRKAKP